MAQCGTFAAPTDLSSSSSEDFVDAPETNLDTESDELFYSFLPELDSEPNQALASFFWSILAYNKRMADTTLTDATIAAPTKEIRMGLPTVFSGKRTDLRKILMTCKMYLQANWTIYNNNEKKVVFILSFMMEGDTASWKDQWLDELDAKAKLNQTAYMDFGTYNDFLKLLEKIFTAFDAEGHGLKEIKNMKFDSKTSMEDHISWFKVLVTQAGNTSQISNIDYFQETLPVNLRSKIMLLNNLPTTLEKWYEWASRIDNT